MDITELVDRVIEDGKITQEEHEEILRAIHGDRRIDEEEERQIERLQLLIKKGMLEVV